MPRNRIMKSQIKFLALGLALFFSMSAFAQDIHWSQPWMSPLTLNPANTGAHDGLWRVNGIYRDQWNSVTLGYKTFGLSFDSPIYRGLGEDDYFGVGLAMSNDRAGDGNLTLTNVMGSVAYHLALDENSKTKLSLGMQAGYTMMSIDLARLYWADEFFNGGFNPGTTGEQLNPNTAYFNANIGLGWRHQISDNIAYYVGASAFNLNNPKASLLKKANNEVGLPIRIGGQFGVDWHIGDRFMIRPVALYQTQAAATELITGSEFNYIIGDAYLPAIAPKVFVGAYMRMGDAIIANLGMEWKGFRVGVAYDYNNSDLSSASGGNGGFEISFQYIKPTALDLFRKSTFPCNRF